MRPIVPALIPKSAVELEDNLSRLAFSPEIHIDVTDGKFVPATSWPYVTGERPKLVKALTDKFTLEVDLMVEDTLSAAEDWLVAGADMLVFHVENTDLSDFMNFATKRKVTIGISALNDTPYKKLEPYLLVADYVQVMGIATIGAQGQPFDERVFARIAEIKASFPDITISIDGSVNRRTLPTIAKNKDINRFICGSAIVGEVDYLAAYTELKSILTNS